MTEIQKLDAVLSFFSKSGFEKGGLNLETSLRLINEKKSLSLDGDESIKILNQLIDDKYVLSEVKREYHETGPLGGFAQEVEVLYYHGTYKGIIFNGDQSYEGEILKRIAENTRLDNLDKALMVNRKRTFLLTVILAFGTSIAAWYYWLEICHKYHWFHW